MITNRSSRKVKRTENRVNPLAIISNFLSMVNFVSWGYSLLEYTGNKLFQIYDVVSNPPLQITIRKRKRNNKQKTYFNRTRAKEDSPIAQATADSSDDDTSFVRKKKSKFLEQKNETSSPDTSSSPYRPSVSEEVKPPANEKIMQLENELSLLRAEISKIATQGISMPTLTKSSEPVDEQRQMHQMLNLAYYEESSYLLPLPPPPPPPITYPTSPTRYSPLPLPSDLPPPPMFDDINDSTMMMPPPPPPCDTEHFTAQSTASPLRATTTRVSITSASASPRTWQVQTDDMEYDAGSHIIGKRSIQRSGKFDLTEILSRSGSLKKVDLDRSPGGTPVRSLEEQEADPSTMSSVDIIAHALRKKFQQINMSPESSPDSEKKHSFVGKENDDSWFDNEDKENYQNRSSLSSTKRPSLTPSKVALRQSYQPPTCDTTL